MLRTGPFARLAASPWTLVAVWALTRLWLVSAALKVPPLNGDGTLDPSVDTVYRGWFDVLASGTFPAHDVSWQYPPGAALPILAPGLLPSLDYGHAFVLTAALTDALVTAGLLWLAVRKGRSPAAAWLWTVALAVLSTMPWNRFDLQVTAVAMAALVVAASSRAWADRAFGALVALGALIKVWPALLLVGTGRGRRTRHSWLSAALAGAVLLAGFALAMPHALSFLTAQKSRGIQIESVGALPFHVARHFGWTGTWKAKDGSHEFVGPYVETVSLVMQCLTVLALGWLWYWRTRRTVPSQGAPWLLPDASLTAVLLFVVTSRVISPQYLVWLVGLAAVCLLWRETSQRPVAWLILAACVFTTLGFPLLYRELRDDADPLAITNLFVRDLLLIAAAGVSAVRLWRVGRTGREKSPPVGAFGICRMHHRIECCQTPYGPPSAVPKS
ncbi:glycosyltransferase 87 family protein [Streptomyces sp. CA-294286]|uniref:glycosyltransferase 87 family protein n=1 Tax=Streptomyces sp. CA-294286 TaxID=3240070 RepID=UPI003D94B2D4